jgi:rhamnose transport system permease protein
MLDKALRWRWELFLAVVLLAVFCVNVSLSEFYLGEQNFVNMFQLSIEKLVVVVVMAFVIINGEIDLSVASVMAFGACVLAALHEAGSVPFELAVVIALLATTAAGAIQGAFVAFMGLPSLVVTLAGLIGWRGAARILVEDRSIGDFPDWFENLGQDPLIGRFSFALIFFIVEIVVAGIVLHRTAFGRAVFVIGNNANVARYSGVNVARDKMLIMTTSGFMAGLAGVLFASRLGSVRGDLATGFELDIITMVLLGGVSIFGGSGTMVGVALSILIVLNIRNGLGLANIDQNTQTGVVGVLLILSVLVPNLVARVAGSWRAARLGERAPPAAEGGETPKQTPELQPTPTLTQEEEER